MVASVGLVASVVGFTSSSSFEWRTCADMLLDDAAEESFGCVTVAADGGGGGGTVLTTGLTLSLRTTFAGGGDVTINGEPVRWILFCIDDA